MVGPVCQIKEKTDKATRDWQIILGVFVVLALAIVAFLLYSNRLIEKEDFSFLSVDDDIKPATINQDSMSKILQNFQNKDDNFKSLQK